MADADVALATPAIHTDLALQSLVPHLVIAGQGTRGVGSAATSHKQITTARTASGVLSKSPLGFRLFERQIDQALGRPKTVFKE